MTLHYRLTEADVQVFADHVLRPSGTWMQRAGASARRIRRARLKSDAVLVLGALFAIVDEWGRWGVVFMLALGLVVWAGSLAPRIQAEEWIREYREALRRWARSTTSQPEFAEYTLEAGEEGLSARSFGSDRLLKWSTLAGVEKTPLGMVVVLTGSEPIIVPARAFENAAAVDAFHELLTSRSDAAKRALADRWLKDRDYPCPKCKYPLRGTAGARCPECGADMLVEWQRLREARG